MKFKILKTSRKEKFTVVELFAGAGGLALGFENAGLQSKMLVEIDKNAVATLKQNKPSWNIIHDDIKNVNFKNVRADVVTGGFPCQSFSYAGKRLGFEDTRGTLFFEFARAIKEIKPKVIMAENVKGLLRHDNGKTLQTMLSIFEHLGYQVAYKVLRAQYFDVAQKRERLVIFGVKKSMSSQLIFPKEQNYTVSLRQALQDVPISPGQIYTETKKQIMSLIPEGGYWKDLPEDLKKKYMGASYHIGGGKTGIARRLSWREPCLTLTCSPSQKQTERCHPTETRPLTIREYARIQSFPDSWDFFGSITSQYRQIGNAVPVNLGYYLGKCIIAMLKQEYKDEL